MKRLPEWLKKKIVCTDTFQTVNDIISSCGLHTVCSSALCPNKGECFGKGTAAFLILGDVCSRKCGFCAVRKGMPSTTPNAEDVDRIVRAVGKMRLSYVVITSVTRDDLQDGGAGHFYDMVTALKSSYPGITVEVLVPDFNGHDDDLKTVLDAHPDVLSHDLETVPSLYATVRPIADYRRSLELLNKAKEYGNAITKSGIMLGLGETYAEVIETLKDLRRAGCDILTMGQYLRPSLKNIPVSRYVTPQEFDHYKQIALDIGFGSAVSGPFVRSSYEAEQSFEMVTA